MAAGQFRGVTPSRGMGTAAGLVRGPGTGTSDSIRADLPRGSYVMPADSARAMGAGVLRSMGGGLPGYVQGRRQGMPVALSRGEYVLPPEQVHGIGARTLDALRQATHQWTAPGRPDAGGDSQRLFLANGGLVDEEERRRQQASFGDAAQPERPGAGTADAPQAAGLPSYAPPASQPQTPSASAGLPAYRLFGSEPSAGQTKDRLASSRHGGLLSVTPGSEGALRAQRAAAIDQGMAGPAEGLPVRQHDGGSWQRRNDLMNAETGAWKLRSSWDKYRDGSLRNYSPQQQAYMAQAKAQADDGGRQALLQQEAMRQQGETRRAGWSRDTEQAKLGLLARQQDEAERKGVIERGAEQAKLGLLARQQDEAERKGVIERGTAGLGFAKALRIEQAQNALMNASTPQEQAQAQQRLAWLTSDTAPEAKLKDNFATVGGGQEWDDNAQTMRNVPQRLIDLRTGREVGQPSPPPRAIHEDRAALAIKNDTSLTRQQKEDKLRALGYT